MDYLTHCYHSDMRLFSDSQNTLARGAWHWCPPGARVLPFAHAFGSMFDDSTQFRHSNLPVGEDRHYYRYYDGRADPRLIGQNWCGSREAWQHGVPIADAGKIPLDIEGVPLCCKSLPARPGGVVGNGDALFLTTNPGGGVLLGAKASGPNYRTGGGVLLGGLGSGPGAHAGGGSLYGGRIPTQAGVCGGGSLYGGRIPTQAGVCGGGEVLGGGVPAINPPPGGGQLDGGNNTGVSPEIGGGQLDGGNNPGVSPAIGGGQLDGGNNTGVSPAIGGGQLDGGNNTGVSPAIGGGQLDGGGTPLRPGGGQVDGGGVAGVSPATGGGQLDGGGIVPQIGGLVLWLDAAQLPNTPGSLRRWPDSSGSGNTASQTTLGLRPSYSRTFFAKGQVDFGGLQWLELASAIPMGFDWSAYCAAVINPAPPANTFMPFLGAYDAAGYYAVPGFYFTLSSISNGDMSLGTNAADEPGTLVYPTAGIVSNGIELVSGPSTCNLYVDVSNLRGPARGGGIVKTAALQYIGWSGGAGGSLLTGSMGELLVFDRFLSAEEDSQIMIYLSNKWGIPL